jgi:hypothetical protein
MTTTETYRGYEIRLEDGESLWDARRLIDDKIKANDAASKGIARHPARDKIIADIERRKAAEKRCQEIALARQNARYL